MTDEELCFTPATELTRMIFDRLVSPVEVMKTIVERAGKLNTWLNALCTPTYDLAMAAARDAEAAVMRGAALGPLHGIPTTIKDLAFTKGVRTMAGSHVFSDRVPDFDHVHVTRLRAAGAISIGKTTTSEFGWTGVSRSPLTGITHNPWKHGMNAGASSAGAGVCAAAGIGPIHQGSDGAGSIRMPASFCGVYGLKPSHGRVPYHPLPANGLISHVGPITRTVADAALMLQAMAGPDDRDMTSIAAEPENFLANLDRGIAGLKVAYSPDLGYLKVDAEVAAPVKVAVHAFEELGCKVEEVNPGWGDPIETEHCLFASHIAGMYGGFLERWAGFSYPFNLTWLPAATCPCGFTPAGLPVGLQIVAGRNRDMRVLQASRAFEQARPWAQHRPPVQGQRMAKAKR